MVVDWFGVVEVYFFEECGWYEYVFLVFFLVFDEVCGGVVFFVVENFFVIFV